MHTDCFLAVSAANAATELLNFHKGSLNEINVTMKTETKNDGCDCNMRL